jgi:hypothetical protein
MRNADPTIFALHIVGIHSHHYYPDFGEVTKPGTFHT